MSAVQTGAWYRPDTAFEIFDVIVDDQEVLSCSELIALSPKHPLHNVPLLALGSKSFVESVPVCFASHIPHILGLPRIANNWAEGIVLKPNQRMSIDHSYAIKRKIPEFDDAKFDESSAWDPNAQLSEQAIGELAARLVNPARWASARSKVGENLDLIFDEVVLDVLIDLEAAFPAAMAAHDGEKIVRKCVTDYWMEE